jgi:hypothetical protein
VKKLWLIKEKLDQIPLCSCGKPKKFNSFSKGYLKTCNSKICVDRNRTESYVKSNMERYGIKNTSVLQSTKDKIQKTNLLKYGSTCSLQNKEVQMKIKKPC